MQNFIDSKKSGEKKSGEKKSGEKKSGEKKGPFYMEEKEKNTKTKKIIILSLCIVTLVFACILGTYAYFMVNISNNNRQEVQLDTGTMRLRFADGNPTINQTIMLGETVEKKFTIENTGDLDASLSIEWLDIVNTYMEGSLTYTLEQSETLDSGYTEIISKTNVPVTDTAFTTTLAPDLEIPAGKTYYYNLKITFNDLEGIDQEADRNAKLTTKFTVSQPSNNRSYSLVIDPNGGTLGSTNAVQTLTKRNGTTETIGTPTKAGSIFKGWKVVGMGSVLTDSTLTIGKSNTKVIAEWEETEASKVLTKLGVTSKDSTGLNFSQPATTDEGVYSMEDDYGMSYFYRGAVTNNYVRFGKWAEETEKAGKDMYWRIIRVNGDGSVRIRYDGTQEYANGTNTADRFTHTEQPYNINLNDNKYVGWMYGTTSGSNEQAQSNVESSNAKKIVEAWYKTNIENQNYGDAIADTMFCNDRNTPGGAETGMPNDLGRGFSTYAVGFGALTRIGKYYGIANAYPTFKCLQKNDAFTVDDTEKGNGALTYPVGLITADEVVTAGSGNYNGNTTNKFYYLYNPNMWSWTLSPYGNSAYNAYNFIVDYNGNISFPINYYNNNYSGAISPVINLKPEYVRNMIGDGTIGNPFRAEEN